MAMVFDFLNYPGGAYILHNAVLYVQFVEEIKK